MSYQNFKLAIEKAKQCEGYSTGTKKSNEIVFNASNLLNLNFSIQHTEFLKELGYLDFFGVEIYGIVKEDFSGEYVGCTVEATLQDRKEYNLPQEWATIYSFDDGYMGYLDYSQLNNNKEPAVIMALYNGERYVVIEKIADDFGDFILQLVEEQLSTQ